MSDETVVNEDARFVDASELLRLRIPEPQFVWDGIIRAKDFVIIAGEPGSGKSVWAINLAVSVGSGTPFLGRQVRAGKVIYIDNENNEEQIAVRLQKIYTAKSLTVEEGRILVVPGAPTLDEMMDLLREKCRNFNPRLIVVDSLYLAQTAKEKEEDKMKHFLRSLKTLASDFDSVVLVIHHFKKGGRQIEMSMEMVSGTSAMARIVDVGLLMRRSSLETSKRIFKVGKIRYGADSIMGEVRLLGFDDDTFLFSDEGVIDERLHLERAPGAIPSGSDLLRDVLSALGGENIQTAAVRDEFLRRGHSQKMADRALRDARARGMIHRQGHGLYSMPEPSPRAQAAPSIGEDRKEG